MTAPDYGGLWSMLKATTRHLISTRRALDAARARRDDALLDLDISRLANRLLRQHCLDVEAKNRALARSLAGLTRPTAEGSPTCDT